MSSSVTTYCSVFYCPAARRWSVSYVVYITPQGPIFHTFFVSVSVYRRRHVQAYPSLLPACDSAHVNLVNLI